MLESRDMAALKPVPGPDGRLAASSDAIHLYSEAARLAFADRNQYVADADFVEVPVAGLLDKSYLAERGRLIGNRSMGWPSPASRPVRSPVAGMPPQSSRPPAMSPSSTRRGWRSP